VSASSNYPLPTGQHARDRTAHTASPVTATVAGAPGTERRGAVSVWSWELDTELGPAGPILVLRVAGEIDLLTVPVLQHALDAAVDQRPKDLVVDLAGVVFCCVRGFALLATAAATAHTNGIGFALSGVPPHVDRIATLLWPEQHRLRYRSAAAAVTAIRIDHTHRTHLSRQAGSATSRLGDGPPG
jgi:anti-sigma B factor antagonist